MTLLALAAVLIVVQLLTLGVAVAGLRRDVQALIVVLLSHDPKE
jgi:hypothetical protein